MDLDALVLDSGMDLEKFQPDPTGPVNSSLF